MGKELTIDFRQMPWSNSPPSWCHHGMAVQEAVQAAIQGKQGRTVVICPASGNENLSAVLTVDARGFSGQVSVSGPADPALEDRLERARTGRLTAFSHELALRYQLDEPGSVTLEIQAPHAEKEEVRFQAMLDTLWDLQLAALAVLEDVFGVSQTPAESVRRQSVVQTLGQESS